MTAVRRLHAVEQPPEPLPAEDMLRQLVPELERAEAAVRRLRALVDAERRRLADERRVAFIRPEAVRREFARSDLPGAGPSTASAKPVRREFAS